MHGSARSRAGRVACLFVFVALFCPGAGWGTSRVALVVGNGGYDGNKISRLENPVNDAELMAKTLEKVGFQVDLVTDADQAKIKASIKKFGKKLVAAGRDSVGLFYYAGHGVEIKGQNYLIPIGAEIEIEVDFGTDAVPADWVLSRMGAARNRLNMVILDACRDNPFQATVRGESPGLAPMNAPSGTLIAYAAAPKQLAKDGEGKNSPYTEQLAKFLVEPGLKVEDVFKRVRVAVEAMTNEEQTPWENSSLRGDFYFVAKVEKPPPKPAPKTVVKTEPSELTVQQLAARAYEAAERVNTIFSYRLFVEQHPDTLYAKLAGEQIRKLERATMPSAEEVEASLGLKPAEREQIQTSLWALGFNAGVPDGKFGSRTREAIRKWQASRGHETTSHLDAGSKNALLAAVPDLSGPIWLTAQNKPCEVWNPNAKPGETLTWSGGCLDGKASGSGRQVWRGSYGESVYKGEVRAGKTHGRGVMKYANGNRYEGEWRASKRHGRGVHTWSAGSRYEGEWRDGKRSGRGNHTWSDGSRYEGEWRDDKRSGRGVVKYATGNRYEGEWRASKRHGRGIFTWSDGSRYEGDIVDDNLTGRGVYTWSDGSRYEGDFVDGKQTGRGVYTGSDGSHYEGDYVDGKLTGRGVMKYTDGNLYEGDFVDAKRTGRGVMKFASGHRYEGEWRDDKRTGRGVMKFASGNRYEGKWRDDKPHGHGTYTRSKGRRYEGQWRKGCFGSRGEKRAFIGTTAKACKFK